MEAKKTTLIIVMIMSTNDTYTQKEIHKQNIYAIKVKVT